jgi:hypothetical protein
MHPTVSADEPKIVHQKWINHDKWISVRDCYKINKMNANQVAAILRYVTLPKAMLNSNSFSRLYQYLNGMKEISAIKLKIKRSPIFPLGKGKWGTLLDDDDDSRKVYWLDSRSPRQTGLEGYIEYRIIDPKYTYRHEAGGKATDQRREESRRINDRNEIVRCLLKILDVRELNDDRILTELQIPWLVEITEIDEGVAEIQYNVLAKIFDAYQAKRNKYDESYLHLFKPISEVLFISEKGEAHRLKNLILPESLHFKNEDKLYSNSTGNTIYLPIKLLTPPPSEAKHVNLDIESDRQDKFKQDWRQFLLHCGIKSKPIFADITQEFDNAWSLQRKDEILFNSWYMAINFTCIQKNSIKIVRCELDLLTKEVIESEKYDRLLMAYIIYKSWKDTFADKARFAECKRQPIEITKPGWYKAFYWKSTYTDKCVDIPDLMWAGLEQYLIPIKTINGNTTTKLKALRLKCDNLAQLIITPRYLDIVAEQNNIGEGPDYAASFLDSLNIRPPAITDVNALYVLCDQENYRDIAKVAIELINIGVQRFGLQLYDFRQNRIRPVSEFKLGKKSRRGCPLIEEQYGEEIGRKLGEIFSLETETEFSSDFLGLFKEYFKIGPNENICKLICIMLKGWTQLPVQQQSLIKQDVKNTLEANSYEQIAISFNDKKLAGELTANNLPCISIEINEADRYLFEDSASAINLTLTSKIGDLMVHPLKLWDGSEKNGQNFLRS